MDPAPTISVVVPTYNRDALLRRTLSSLEAQRLPAGELEVVVADDGSSDATRETVRSFETRLRLRYHFQSDDGFRAGAARNAGARLATGPVIAFLDTGVLAGPDFARAHRDAHRQRRRAVLGTTYGYNTEDPWAGLAAVLERRGIEQTVADHGGEPRFQDMRHPIFAGVGYDLRRLVAPWYFHWTVNLSLPAEEFWAVGGFDEDFRGWGGEDQELGYRLVRNGVTLVASRDPWGIEVPHERATADNVGSAFRNALLFLHRHPDPEVEVFFSLFLRHETVPRLEVSYAQLVEGCRAVAAGAAEARESDVGDELTGAMEIAGNPRSVLVLGCGAAVPACVPARSTVMDVDATLLARALDGGRYHGRHGIGVATTFYDGTFDAVLISSRLAGLWDTWGTLVLAEAARVGRTVVAPFLRDAPIRAAAPGGPR